MEHRKSTSGYTTLEMGFAIGLIAVLGVLVAQAGFKVYETSSLAVSANNLRVLSAGAAAYLADHQYRFWPFREDGAIIQGADGMTERGTQFWFGFEPLRSRRLGEGRRFFNAEEGPLGGYVPAAMRPDPSFARGASAFKPKYRSGYIGIGYNGVLAGFNQPPVDGKPAGPMSQLQLSNPSRVVVFATSAQVNTFQPPASARHPMLEEFYLIDQREVTVHFRHGDTAMIAFADGSVGFLPLDESTLDRRSSDAKIGRFAPVGSYQYLR